MITSLLSSLQTQLFSKSLLISNLLPLLVFGFANAVVCRESAPAAFARVRAIYVSGDKTLTYSGALVLLFTASYVLSTLNVLLLEMLEGKRRPVSWFRRMLYPRQLARVRRLDAAFDKANAGMIAVGSDAEAWISSIDTALRQQGVGTGQSVPYPHAVLEIARRRSRGDAIPAKDLRDAVTAFVDFARAAPATSPDSHDLRADAKALKDAIRFSRDKFLFDTQRLYNQRQFTLPGEYPASDRITSDSVLAPTRFGNIGLTMRSYALRRYRLDLNVFWGRLQGTIETTAKPLFDRLADAKIRVDAMVMLFWLTVAFTAGWTAWLAVYGTSIRALWLVGIGGPAACVLWYELCCVSYMVMADIVRGGVDLCRFGLLKDFSLPVPLSTTDERDLWHELGQAVGYADRTIIFTYEQKKP